MRKSAIALGMVCAALTPGLAQASGFDGFRMGLEATWSSHTVDVDASEPREDGLDQYMRGIAAGNRSLADAIALRDSNNVMIQNQAARLAAGAAQVEEARRQRDALLGTAIPPVPTLPALPPLQLDPRLQGTPAAAAAQAAYAAQADRLAQANAAIEVEYNSQLQARDNALSQLNEGIQRGEASLASGNALLNRGRRDMSLLEDGIARGTVSRDRAVQDMTALQLSSPLSQGVGSGAGIRLSAGYGRSFGRIYVGGEVDVTQENHSLNLKVLNRRDINVGFSTLIGSQIRVGYQVMPWAMPFASIGVETGEWKVRSSTGNTTTDWHPQGRAGVGVEFLLSDRTIVRASYERSFGGEFRLSGATSTAHRDTFKLGLVRTF